MTPEKVKALLPVLTAYAQGKTIQCQDMLDDRWFDIICATFDGPVELYRVKPDPIILKYRRYIWKDLQGLYVASFAQSTKSCIENIEKMPYFVRWIDTNWVTYECEI